VGLEFPDSLGWRYTHVTGPGLSFRYPTFRADSVIDRWAPDCTSAQPLYQEWSDSTVDNAIVVSSAPASFETTADLFGFERPNLAPAIVCDERNRCSSVGPWQLKEGKEWFPDGSDSVQVGPWRGLIGTMTILGYFNDIPDSLRSPDDDPNATFPKESLYHTRFFAAADGGDGCGVVISWRGDPVSDYHGGREKASWDSASLEHMLRTARFGRVMEQK
jgi:hypothetical protein